MSATPNAQKKPAKPAKPVNVEVERSLHNIAYVRAGLIGLTLVEYVERAIRRELARTDMPEYAGDPPA